MSKAQQAVLGDVSALLAKATLVTAVYQKAVSLLGYIGDQRAVLNGDDSPSKKLFDASKNALLQQFGDYLVFPNTLDLLIFGRNQ